MLFKPPLPPMEARSVEEIPTGQDWQYEPKWDGFRCIAFRDAAGVYLQSKAGQPLARYFPDVVDALASLPQQHFVVDGELVVPVSGALSFDELQLRLHPAASRIQKLAKANPAMYIVFDLLAETRQVYLRRILRERRQLLEKFARSNFKSSKTLHLSPATTDYQSASEWFKRAGGDLDGVLAKRLDAPYASGERTAMVKVKQIRTADCVVGGFRYARNTRVVGSLLLGLYGDDELLHHVGFTSAFKASERRGLTKKFVALKEPPGFTGNAPGGPSRWSTDRTGEWEPVAPRVVIEVAYDHFTGGRFRHGTKFIRWRADKKPRQCTMDQLEPNEGKALLLS
jgi:ATP-dependent DNA ligase